jgi:catechol 2,3-dioxygenase-like lactoylglutathione lyase family enzyme
MGITIDRIDHIVLNCRDVNATADWYQRALGMLREPFGPDGRIALKFGNQKINLRPTNAPNWATAAVDAPGSLDLCFITTHTPADVLAHFNACGIVVTNGPSSQSGALGQMTSIYCRDPDGNLVEVANYAAAAMP